MPIYPSAYYPYCERGHAVSAHDNGRPCLACKAADAPAPAPATVRVEMATEIEPTPEAPPVVQAVPLPPPAPVPDMPAHPAKPTALADDAPDLDSHE